MIPQHHNLNSQQPQSQLLLCKYLQPLRCCTGSGCTCKGFLQIWSFSLADLFQHIFYSYTTGSAICMCILSYSIGWSYHQFYSHIVWQNVHEQTTWYNVTVIVDVCVEVAVHPIQVELRLATTVFCHYFFVFIKTLFGVHLLPQVVIFVVKSTSFPTL